MDSERKEERAKELGARSGRVEAGRREGGNPGVRIPGGTAGPAQEAGTGHCGMRLGADFWNKIDGALNIRNGSCGAQKQNSVLALKPLRFLWKARL